MATPRTRRLIVAPLVLLLLICALYQGRRWFIRTWFARGAARPPAPRTVPEPAPTGPVRPVRVLLIDGLSESLARELPALGRVCAAGLTLRVDVGFPTVSLPVQHVLWTGTWQSQSGVMFLVRTLERPVFDSLQRRVTERAAEGVAVAESHPYIVRSFPFSRIVAPEQEKGSLTPETLERESLEAARSDAALVFVHFLAVDEAGHETGAAGSGYGDAARRGDRLLGALWSARDPRWTVLALSDHGHHARPPGGHGGPEPAIRRVRACLAGPGVPAGQRAEAVLPDLTRILADRLNVGVPRLCQGRSLSEVLAGAPARGAPSPLRPGALGFLVPLLAAGLVFETGRRSLGGASAWLLSLPWGMGLGLLLVVAQHGPPSLSRFYVYRALPVELLGDALLAAAASLLQAWTLRRLGAADRALGAMTALCLLPPLATVALTGWPLQRPPLVPYLTAWASTLCLLAQACLAGLLVASVVRAVAAVRSRRTAAPPPEKEAR